MRNYPQNTCEFYVFCVRNDIKSYGKFAIFSKLKIERGWVKSANFGKIETKDRDY